MAALNLFEAIMERTSITQSSPLRGPDQHRAAVADTPYPQAPFPSPRENQLGIGVIT
jgi:hypothetical protein